MVTYPAVQSEPDFVRGRENHKLETLYPTIEVFPAGGNNVGIG